MAKKRPTTTRAPSDLSFTTLPSGRPSLVSAYFSKLENAIDAARGLEERGYDRDQISVFMSSERRRHYLETRPEFAEMSDRAVVDTVELKKQRKTVEGMGAGGAIGGGLGAVGAAIAAVGTTLVIPPLGIAVAGPVAAALAGTGAGAVAGGLVGALMGAGMSEYRAEKFEQLLKDGHLIVAVEATTDAERSDLEEQLTDFGGEVLGHDEDEL